MSEVLTPLMQQYQRVKREIPSDTLLLFRLGDFYEMFFDDAKAASELLNLTLTQRNGAPMCGIPHHSSENYIARLIRQGRKVAICEQLEEAGQSKGIIKRDVTQILSPGTVMADRFLVASQNNFIAAICPPASGKMVKTSRTSAFVTSDGTTTDKPQSANAASPLEHSAPRTLHSAFGLAWLDITTGDFRVTELPDPRALLSEIRRLSPAEILLPEGNPEFLNLIKDGADPAPRTSLGEPWTFDYETAFFTLRDHFKTQSLDGFGCQGMGPGVGAAGSLIHYLQNQLRRSLNHIHRLQPYFAGDFMTLDMITQRNLELLERRQGGSGSETTLVGSLDRTVTPMGARLLREWVTRPLRSVEKITARSGAIAELHENGSPLEELREKLRPVKDLERLVGRLAGGNGNARDLIGLKLSLQSLPDLQKITITLRSPLLAEQHGQIKPLPDLENLIQKAIMDDPPLALKEGGLIKPGFDATLDELQGAMRSGKDWVARLQQQEIEKTGIKSLKVRFNSVFGYYIEVTKSNLGQVPAHYIRKQTIATGERFITPELKEMENKILGAEERAIKLEYDLFQKIREEAVSHSASIQETARAIAVLDVAAGLAETARHQNHARPLVDESDVIQIEEGRHPVLEQIIRSDSSHLAKGGFVPNDTLLDSLQNQVILITGPNMAGKSTYIRQVALMVLMAQIGAFVPAKSARIGVVDRIFTRVGASDDLSRGQSTFMVEMNETAGILNNATSKSLVILDEIGRGTSTYDGISIAWAVAEYLHERVGARTLFATHYHELTAMARRFPRVKNFNVAVREWNDQVIFLHKIQPGGADKSYGIQVARLAGLPHEVLDCAKNILNRLEAADLIEQPSYSESPSSEDHSKKAKQETLSSKPIKPTSQMLLFAANRDKEDWS